MCSFFCFLNEAFIGVNILFPPRTYFSLSLVWCERICFLTRWRLGIYSYSRYFSRYNHLSIAIYFFSFRFLLLSWTEQSWLLFLLRALLLLLGELELHSNCIPTAYNVRFPSSRMEFMESQTFWEQNDHEGKFIFRYSFLRIHSIQKGSFEDKMNEKRTGRRSKGTYDIHKICHCHLSSLFFWVGFFFFFFLFFHLKYEA